MLSLARNSLWRALYLCAKKIQKTPVHRRKAPTGTLPPLSERIARDIGLSPHEREMMTVRWPSQETRHPYL